MASFRDRENPEALRFPCDLRVQVLFYVALAVDLAAAAAVLFTRDTVSARAFDAALLALLLIFKLRHWPRQIVADQFGLHSLGLFNFWNVRIPWHDVESAASTEIPFFGPSPLGLRNDTLEFRARSGGARIVHTPHHPDRDRLLREVRLRGAGLQDPALP